jgi:hypothetical protein
MENCAQSNRSVSAHMVRATSATAAFNRDVPISAIMSAACWSNAETFFRHYKLPASFGSTASHSFTYQQALFDG